MTVDEARADGSPRDWPLQHTAYQVANRVNRTPSKKNLCQVPEAAETFNHHKGDANEDPINVLPTTRVNYATVRPKNADKEVEE